MADIDPKAKAFEEFRRKEESHKGAREIKPREDPRELIKRALTHERVPLERIAYVMHLVDQIIAEMPRPATAGTVVDLCDCGQPDCPLCSRSGMPRSR